MKKLFVLIATFALTFVILSACGCNAPIANGDELIPSTSLQAIGREQENLAPENKESQCDRTLDAPSTSTPSEETPSKTEGCVTEHSDVVFDVENIVRITVYGHYGRSKGCDVPEKYMGEIMGWLESFIIGDKVADILPPGTNTNYIEVQYFDGTIVKKGMDVISVDGVAHFVKHDKEPDCFYKVLQQAISH